MRILAHAPVAALALLLSLAPGARAQEVAPHAIELRAGAVTPVGSYAEDNQLAAGWSLGGAYVYHRGMSALALEYDRVALGMDSRAADALGDGEVVHDLATAGARFFLPQIENVYLGVGAALARETARLATRAGDYSMRTDWSPGLVGSAGVRLPLTGSLAAAVDGRYVWYRARMDGETLETANTMVQLRAGVVVPLR